MSSIVNCSYSQTMTPKITSIKLMPCNSGSLQHSQQEILNCSVRKNVINFLSTMNHFGDFPGGPVVNNLACNPGDVGLIPGWGTKIPHACGATKPMHRHEKSCIIQQ